MKRVLAAVAALVSFVTLASLATLATLGVLPKPLEAALLTGARLAPSPLIGQPAPAFVLPRLGAPAQSLAPADLHGQVWVLNVWASWCAPCREEHPLLVQVARDDGVRLVGLNYKDDPRQAQEWLLRLGDPYAMTVLDREGRTGADYGLQGVPMTFVVDRAGTVRFSHAGRLTAELWKTRVLPLVRQLEG